MPEFLRRIRIPLLGFVVSTALTMTFVAFHRNALRVQFEMMCDDQVHAIERNLLAQVNLLRTVQSFARVSPTEDWRTLHEFVGNFSLLNKDVARYYWWNPEVDAKLVQALEEYPEDSRRVSLGDDLIRSLVTTSIRDDLPAGALLKPRSREERPLYVVALPVFRASPRAHGVVLAFDSGRLIEEALSASSLADMQLTIRDRAGNVLYRSARPAPRGRNLGRLFNPTPQQSVYSRQIAFAGSVWSVEAVSAAGFPDTDALACWGVLAFGLMMTAPFDSYVEHRRREAAAMHKAVSRSSHELSEARVSLRASEDRFRMAYEDAAVGMVMTDHQGRVVAVNQSACQIFATPESELVGTSVLDLQSNDEQRVEARRKMELLARRVIASYHAERQMKKKGGQTVWVRVSVSRIESEARLTNFFTLLEDITAQVESRNQLEFHATHDALTGLMNRRAFEQRLGTAIGAGRDSAADLALMYIDLDGFKFINDSLGHATGDLLLRQVAPRLEQCLRGTENLARVGGDEFTVILESRTGREEIAQAAQDVLNALQQPFEVDGHELFVSVSIGISVFPADGFDAGALVKHADAAMYQAKHEGRGQYCFFSAEMAESAAARLRLESDLRRALANHEIQIYYQPMVSAAGNDITRFEALCRWRRYGKEMVPPARFIPVAEESGLIVPLGAWVMEQACREAEWWNRLSAKPIRVAVNVSFVQLAQRGFVASVQKVLDATGLAPSLLELELTESTVMRDPEQTLRVLEQLEEMGISLVLDDFGTGYSSLSHLQGIPLAAVKVDQSFVASIAESRRSEQLVSSLIALAHGLGLEVVGEGVEFAEQAAMLRSMKCDLLQGFLVGEPMDAQRTLRLVAGTARRAEETESLLALASAAGAGEELTEQHVEDRA